MLEIQYSTVQDRYCLTVSTIQSHAWIESEILVNLNRNMLMVCSAYADLQTSHYKPFVQSYIQTV